MAGDNDRSRLLSRRAVLVGGLQVGLFGLLAGRVYYLSVIEGERYRTLAEENRVNFRLLSPARGQILDRNGAPLALNQQNFRVVLLPEQMEELAPLLDRLNNYIPLSDNDRKRIERDLRNNSGLNAVVVKDNLTRDQMDAVAVRSLDLPGIDIDVGEVRTYPYAAVTSHLLGYVGTVSDNDLKKAEADDDDDDEVLGIPGFRIGKNGIEKHYDAALRGRAGTVQMEVNARGSVVRELTRNDPESGQTLTLTVDIGLQQYVQQRLGQEESAAAVVLDVENGGILAMVSQPAFDPNLFTYGISQEDWSALNTDIHTPMLNKCITGVYAPGSTLKPLVALAGLDSGILDPSDRVYCPGYYELGDHKFHCWKHGGHGRVNMHEAIAQSCDTYFYDLAHKLGIDKIQAMCRRFGLGQKTGIDMPHERAGFVPNRTWKLTSKRQTWQQGETLIAAIGQGYMLTSPLQLAVMAARIANGGRAVIPHVVKKSGDTIIERPAAASLGISQRHLDLVENAMNAVVNQNIGTAYGSRITKSGMEFGGKTGTSQVRRISEDERRTGVLSNDSLPWKDRDHALFTGFAPTDKPRYAIGVIIEHGGSGGHTAAPIARDILLECQQRLQG